MMRSKGVTDFSWVYWFGRIALGGHCSCPWWYRYACLNKNAPLTMMSHLISISRHKLCAVSVSPLLCLVQFCIVCVIVQTMSSGKEKRAERSDWDLHWCLLILTLLWRIIRALLVSCHTWYNYKMLLKCYYEKKNTLFLKQY